MSYDGEATTQLDGSRYAHQNCVVAQLSTLADAISFSYWDPWPPALRGLTGDKSGGITYDAGVAAVKKATNGEVRIKVLYWTTEATLDDMIDDGRACAVSIKCSVTRYTPFNTGTYTGRHCIGVYDQRTVTLSSGKRQKQGLVMDPGHSEAKFVWWPWSLIIRAARASTGSAKIHIMYTADRTAVTLRTRAKGAIRSSAKIADNKVGSFPNGASLSVVDSLKGGDWNINGHWGSAWVQLGPKKFVAGGKLLPKAA